MMNRSALIYEVFGVKVNDTDEPNLNLIKIKAEAFKIKLMLLEL